MRRGFRNCLRIANQYQYTITSMGLSVFSPKSHHILRNQAFIYLFNVISTVALQIRCIISGSLSSCSFIDGS